jgi:hypothetical protein
MTTRFSLINGMKKGRWGESYLEEPLQDWPIILDYLRRLWRIGEDTVLETEFYEPFEKPVRKL